MAPTRLVACLLLEAKDRTKTPSVEEHAPTNNTNKHTNKGGFVTENVQQLLTTFQRVNKLICAVYMMFESSPLNLVFNICTFKACALQTTTTCCLLNADPKKRLFIMLDFPVFSCSVSRCITPAHVTLEV